MISSDKNVRDSGVAIEIDSKLPDIGTTIFTVMSALANEHGALNLSQGFPDFDGPEALRDAVTRYVNAGHNQYPPMAGVASLRQAIATKVAALYGAVFSPDEEITVTAGATEALFCAISAVVRPGDEVIVIDPAYDSYDPVVRLQGGICVHVPMRIDNDVFSMDWQRVRDAITPKTRLIITNSPHNPTGMVWQATDIEALQQIIAQHGLFVVADEVYEHIVFDDASHLSLCGFEDLRQRSFVISSFGKTYHVTGWKVGYCVAPAALMTEFRRVHQFVNFTVNTPMQYALADFLESNVQHHLGLPKFYEAKRDLFCSLLQGSRFELSPSAGTFFQILNYAQLSTEDDVELARRWTQEHKLASIPISVFYADRSELSTRILRFCFAKDDATLRAAGEILCSL